jgi:hypothetical protein
MFHLSVVNSRLAVVDHIADGGVEELYHVHLSDVSTVREAVYRVQAGLAALKPGAWLQGDGWDEGKLAERRYLTAADLDGVSPDGLSRGAGALHVVARRYLCRQRRG